MGSYLKEINGWVVMEKNKIGFKGKSYLESDLEDHKGDWVLINLRNNGSYSGNLCDLNDRKVFLLPYQKVTYRDDGSAEYIIEHNGLPYSHERGDITNYRPTSEKEALNFCKSLNRKANIEYSNEIEILKRVNSNNQNNAHKKNLDEIYGPIISRK